MKPWYKKGLSFACTQCGKCCSGSPGYVWVSIKEIEEMATYLQISVKELIQMYTREINGRLSLKEQLHDYACIFLRDNRCWIYSARPKQCRTFPFWPENLASEKAWAAASQACEGIDHQHAPVIPLSVIKEKLREREE